MQRPLPSPALEQAFLERSGEVSLVSGEVSVEDFAFADTVMVPDLPLDPMPGSYRNPEPLVGEPAPTERRPQGIASHVRTAWDEMNLLWSATAESDAPVHVGRRLRTFFSFFEWQREDVLRATWFALAMLVVIATVTALALTR